MKPTAPSAPQSDTPLDPRRRRRAGTLSIAALGVCALVACSGGESSPNTGGASGSGGTNATGGTSASGGTLGGAPNTAGTTASGAGGSSAASGGAGGQGASAGASSGAGGDVGLGGRAGMPSAGVGGQLPMAGAGGAGSGGASAGVGGTGGAPPAASCDAVATVADMKLGWNLGNSLDSNDPTKSDTAVETAWGNPTVTPALLAAVAAAGFGAVRIPVTWIGRFGAAPDYTISPAFFARVEEVVGYALDQNLYVIINVHHDGAEGVDGEWIKLVDDAGQVSTANTEAVLVQFRKIWTQIAARFANYDARLLFESMNEIKVGYGAPLPAYYDDVNGLNQAFVETVRASGGNNAGRCLVVPGYNTNIEYTVAGFEKPTDTSPGKLILSDHYYDPWSFAGEGSTHAWGTGNPGVDNWGQEEWVVSQVAKLKTTFIDQGLPMIWGEYGAVNQTGYENYRRYYFEYVTKAVHDAGIVPFVWDNGSKGSGAEAFSLFDRSNNTVIDTSLLQALQRAVTSNYRLDEVEKP